MSNEGLIASIGRYDIERLLGTGAMGRVFLARDPDLDRYVAIKTLKDLELREDARERFLKRFRNEARAAARLQHPNIVQVFDVGEDPEVGPYLVFEYVAGESLKQALARRRVFEVREAAEILRSLAGGLDVAHAAKIIHRDIKPENILIAEDGTPKLADFGVARVPNAALTREGQFLGTPAYAAPETLGHGQSGARSDLFSLANVVYELITGRRAFPGQGAVEVAHRVIHDTPTPPSQISPLAVSTKVDRVLSRALSKSPKARYASARELSEAFDAAASGGVFNEGRTLGSWGPLLAVIAGGGLILVALISAMNGEVVTGSDAGMEGPPDAERVENLRDGAQNDMGSVSDARRPMPLDARVGDAEPTSPDAETPADASLTPHEREEIAKDALDAARAALRDGDRAGALRAMQALQLAEAHDPGNADIAPLRQAGQALLSSLSEPDAAPAASTDASL